MTPSTITIPGVDAQGFIAREVLRALALDTSRTEFLDGIPVLVPYVARGESAVTPVTPLAQHFELARRGTVCVEEDEPAAGTSSRNGKGDERIAVLGKRAGNPFGTMVTIGRSMSNDIVLSMGTISKVQGCFARRTDGGWCFTPQRSRNGTKRNGVQLAPGEPCPLEDGDRLDLGLSLEVEFVLPETLHGRLRAE